MTTRTSSKTVIFEYEFSLEGIDQPLPPGHYRVDTDEDVLDGLSFLAYRRVSTMIFLPAEFSRAASIEVVIIDPLDLQRAQDRDFERARASDASQPLDHQHQGIPS